MNFEIADAFRHVELAAARDADPDIHAVLVAVYRGDRTALPALRGYLERALEMFTDAQAAGERNAAKLEGLSQAEIRAAMQRLMAPMTLFRQLVAAADHMPDSSLETVLQALADRIPDADLLDALDKIKSLKPNAAAEPKLVDIRTSRAEEAEGGGIVVRLLREEQYQALPKVLRRAQIGDLIAGLLKCVVDDNPFRHDIESACHRHKESEVLLAVRPWIGDADPKRREAAAWALSRQGDEGAAPNARTIEVLHTLVNDPEPDVIVAALWALAERSARNFTDADLDLMRRICERHPSLKVRDTYSGVFYSPYVAGQPARGGLDAWSRLATDDDSHQRYLACARLGVFLYDHMRRPDTNYEKIRATFKAALNDSCANVRFSALRGLTDLGETHEARIRAELDALAERVERADPDAVARQEVDGLGLASDMLIQPSRRYVAALQRISRAVPEEDRGIWDTLVENCRSARG